MEQTTITFEPTVWPDSTEEITRRDEARHFTAEIVPPRGHWQFEGMFLAAGIRHEDAEYVILHAIRTDISGSLDADQSHPYRAFKSNLKLDPAEWQKSGWSTTPHLMCRPVILQRYDAKPFGAWEFHQPTPGEGWYVMLDQNIEYRTAPASQWLYEIQYEVLPRIKTRLDYLPKILERSQRICRQHSGAYNDIAPLVREKALSHVTPNDLVKDNLVGTVEDYSRCEWPEVSLSAGICESHVTIPRLERRLIQGRCLIDALRPMGSQPIEMQRTMIYAQRKYSLPVPREALSIAIKSNVAPTFRIRM